MLGPNSTSTLSCGGSTHGKRTGAPDPREIMAMDNLGGDEAFEAKFETTNFCASASAEGSRSTTEQSATSSTIPLERLIKLTEQTSHQEAQDHKPPDRAIPPAMSRLAEKYILEAFGLVEELIGCARHVLKAGPSSVHVPQFHDSDQASTVESKLAAYGAGCVVVGATSQDAAFKRLAEAFCATYQQRDLALAKFCAERLMICVPGGIIPERSSKLRGILEDIQRHSKPIFSEASEAVMPEMGQFGSLFDALCCGTHQIFLFEVVDPTIMTETPNSLLNAANTNQASILDGKCRKILFAEIQKRIDFCLSVVQHALDTKFSSLVRKSQTIDTIISRDDRLRRRIERRRESLQRSRNQKAQAESRQNSAAKGSRSMRHQSPACTIDAERQVCMDTTDPTPKSSPLERRGKKRHSQRPETDSESESVRRSASVLYRFLRRRPESERSMKILSDDNANGVNNSREALRTLSPNGADTQSDRDCRAMVSVSNAVWDPDACRAPRLRLSMAMDIQIAALRMLNPDHVPNSLDALQNLCDLLEELRQMKKTCLVCVFLQRWSRGATFAIAGRRLLSPKDIAMIDAGIMKVKFQVADEKIDSSTLERVWNILRKKHIVNFSSISGRIVKPGYRYLHFEENNRPPYYGPWPLLRQIERIRPRAPFAILDSDLIDYDCDSDADWEDEGCGEDLSSCSCDEVAENSSSSIEDGTGSEADAEFIDDGHELSETESYHTGSQDDALQGKCRLPLTESHEARLLPDENRSPSSPANHQPKLIQRFITGIQYEIKSESVLNQFKVIPCISAPTELYIEEPDMPSTKASPLRTPTKGESATPHHHERFVEKKQDPAAKATTHLNIWSAFQRVVPKRARRADPFDDTKNEIDANNEEVISRLREADAWRLEPSTAGGLRNPQSDNPTALGHDQELIEPRDL